MYIDRNIWNAVNTIDLVATIAAAGAVGITRGVQMACVDVIMTFRSKVSEDCVAIKRGATIFPRMMWPGVR